MMRKCHFCAGKVKEEEAKVDFWWGDELFIFENVPAEVCQQCGEKFFTADVYRQMENAIQRGESPVNQITVDVMNFRKGIEV